VIACCRSPEPEDFDVACRRPGRKWLAEHPDAERPKDFWSSHREALALAFEDRCAYAAMSYAVGLSAIQNIHLAFLPLA
jgi:hypothetical protein